MNEHRLSLASLEKALKQFKKSLEFCTSELAAKDSELFLQFRTAAIQGFEYTYELSLKMLRRQLEQIEASSDLVAQQGFKDLLRLAALRGLVRTPEAWFEFREYRNITSHIYDENKAKEVYKILPFFLEETNWLFQALQKRNMD